MNAGRPTRVLFDATRIAMRVDELAAEIDASTPADDELVAVVVLRGAFVFAADLLRALARRGRALTVELLTLESYGDGTESSGEVRVLSRVPGAVRGRDVLVVEDILDSGRTLEAARASLAAAGAARVRCAVLLDKPSRRVVPERAEFVGFEIPDLFVVGYGLDHAGRWRELPYVSHLDDAENG